MDQNRQNIYEVPSHKDSDGEKSGKRGSDSNPWQEMFKQSRRSATIFRIVILAFLIFLTLFVIEQIRSNKDSGYVDYTKRKSESERIRVEGGSILDFKGDIQGQLIMDELEEMPLGTVPESGDVPLNIHWIKQAAAHLLRAGKAYDLEEWNDAIRHYQKAKRIIPEMEGIDARLGLCHMRLDQYNYSAVAFAEATTTDTNSYRVLNNLGVAHLADKEYDKAARQLSKVLTMKPNYAPAHYNLALLYYRTEMYQESAEHFEEYFSHNPVDVDALQIYTKALIELERWEDAAKALQTSSEKMPKAAPIYMTLAHVLSQTGDLDAAMKNLKEGVSLLDRPKALALVASPEYDKLRKREDFRALVDQLSAGLE